MFTMLLPATLPNATSLFPETLEPTLTASGRARAESNHRQSDDHRPHAKSRCDRGGTLHEELGTGHQTSEAQHQPDDTPDRPATDLEPLVTFTPPPSEAAHTRQR